ncbi:hypothetical protein CKO_03726 [Citrobacter koseri ATCC BAA-895]|uniref:Uncharacterized protein n=1 Tax=Citrobacter koseri (strain ATCC BAA-895 / CDC 4225-83 / SGSC4696) TaxID=290338 RepID=A8AMT9_CITK8|nr:hypothetical protein CKO_03726 [Citrobacter koseri ATCC BAA-895]
MDTEHIYGKPFPYIKRAFLFGFHSIKPHFKRVFSCPCIHEINDEKQRKK